MLGEGISDLRFLQFLHQTQVMNLRLVFPQDYAHLDGTVIK